MAESIFVRVQRVVSGGVESAVDMAEQLSGTSMIRQAMREMDAAIARTRDEADEALLRRLQAERQIEAQRRHLATLKDQARFAMDKGRDDLAEAAITRQIDIEGQIDRLAGAEAESKAEEAQLLESLAALKLRKSQMEQQLADLESAQRSARIEADAPRGAAARAQRKADRAEEAFDRAMARNFGHAGERPTAEAAAKMAEIEALQKEAAVAERLAAMRAAAAKPSGRKPAKPKAARG
jgi:phage shock protein A